jgi:hypothetical protein
MSKFLILAGCVLALGLGCVNNPNFAGEQARKGVTTHTYFGDPDLTRGGAEFAGHGNRPN